MTQNGTSVTLAGPCLPLVPVIEKRYSNPVAGFTKLFSSLIFSTVWREEMHVKVVWITMLAMANRNGDVLASVPGLADAARVSLEQCIEALNKLGAPDKWSRTQENEGRRIVAIDGGWRLLNYQKYRELRDADERRIQVRENVRAFRARKSESATVTDVSPGKPKQKQRQKQTTTKTALRAVWVAEMGKAWEDTYGGSAPYGRIAGACKELAHTKDPIELMAHWTNYLYSTAAKFASPNRFAETYGSWAVDGGGAAKNAPVSEDDAATAFRKAGLELGKFPVRPGGYENRAALERAITARLRAQEQPST